ncbi:hypothetical protein C1646_677183 [Rhizophagus diaphanus]|nr:hypothetical protein C1646_677183 [Rhizophagus diaphanus] [Rhizophagus sp. MUCL 43196]
MKILTADQKKLHVKRRTYECTHFGNHVSKKIINLDNQRNRGNYQVNCPWHVNATKPKKENSIEKDLYNIIQKVKVGQKEVVKNDSANFLHYLYEKKQQEPEWFFEFRLSENDQRLTSLIWMLPNQYSYYIRFHEVLIFDCTAGTNHYDMMKHSFFYDTYLVDKDTIQQINNTDDNESFWEDDYDATHILLQTIIGKIQNLLIVKIWKVKPELSQTKSHFVVLMTDGSFSCTCNLLISYEKLQGIILAELKYEKVFDFAKKALDLTQKLDCYNELNGLL